MSPSNSAGPGSTAGRQSRSVPSIPLTDANFGASGEPTIGNLVKEATASASTLFRSEVALAKAEITQEAKKAGAGTGLLIGAGVMLLYSSFFFFFFLAELLAEWLPRWASFGIVFLLLILVTAVAGIGGYLVFRRVRAPKKTMESVRELQTMVSSPLPSAPTHPGIPAARDLQRD